MLVEGVRKSSLHSRPLTMLLISSEQNGAADDETTPAAIRKDEHQERNLHQEMIYSEQTTLKADPCPAPMSSSKKYRVSVAASALKNSNGKTRGKGSATKASSPKRSQLLIYTPQTLDGATRNADKFCLSG